MLLPLCSALVRLHLKDPCPVLSPPVQERYGLTGASLTWVTKMIKGLKHLLYGRLKELRLFQSGEDKIQEGLIHVCKYMRGATRDNGHK